VCFRAEEGSWGPPEDMQVPKLVVTKRKMMRNVTSLGKNTRVEIPGRNIGYENKKTIRNVREELAKKNGRGLQEGGNTRISRKKSPKRENARSGEVGCSRIRDQKEFLNCQKRKTKGKAGTAITKN